MIRQMQTIEFKAKFDEVIKSVELTGAPVAITKDGKPHVKLVRIEPGDDLSGPSAGKPHEVRKAGPLVRSRSRKGRNG